jgi:hypothetical protein
VVPAPAQYIDELYRLSIAEIMHDGSAMATRDVDLDRVMAVNFKRLCSNRKPPLLVDR